MHKGKELKEKREKLGLSRVDVEKSVRGISYTDLRDLEDNGTISPKMRDRIMERQAKEQKLEKFYKQFEIFTR